MPRPSTTNLEQAEADKAAAEELIRTEKTKHRRRAGNTRIQLLPGGHIEIWNDRYVEVEKGRMNAVIAVGDIADFKTKLDQLTD